jgi:hypothetical protein
MALPRVSSKSSLFAVALSAQKGTESMIPKARVCAIVVSMSSIEEELHKDTHINDSLERAENGGNGAEEDALQKTGLANDDLKQVLVDDNKLYMVRSRYARRSCMGKKLTLAKASQTSCSAAVSV